MPKRSEQLDGVFQSLADPTRRAILEHLGRRPASVSDLALPFKMALPSFTQHLGVLERNGLVRSRKRGRVRTYHLVPERMHLAQNWLEQQRRHWNQRLNQLDSYLLDLKEQTS